MDWYDYLHALEKKRGWLYDLGGYTGCVELYRTNTRQLVGRFDMEQIKIFMQGMYIFYDDPILDVEDIKKDLDSLDIGWRVKDANFNQLEEACYVRNYMLQVK